jgi:hypothetical protein
MDERSIAPYLSMKRLSAELIHQELVDMIGLEVIADSTLTWYLHTARFTGHSANAPLNPN